MGSRTDPCPSVMIAAVHMLFHKSCRHYKRALTSPVCSQSRLTRRPAASQLGSLAARCMGHTLVLGSTLLLITTAAAATTQP
jgi:hypothetical protein